MNVIRKTEHNIKQTIHYETLVKIAIMQIETVIKLILVT